MSKRIVILGAGESGTGAALLAKANGYDVFVSDFGEIKSNYRDELNTANIQFEEKKHTDKLILNASIIIKSPGIPDTSEIIKKIRLKGIKVISEIEFASEFTDARFVAITGTNGKTTTTLLTYHLLNSGSLKVGLAGNIGKSLARQVSIDGRKGKDIYVIELSSFQLDGMYDFRAHVGILLNITPDHLDRYNHDFKKYSESKFRIINNMTEDDAFIFWADDPIISERVINSRILPQKKEVSLENKETHAFKDLDYLNIDGFKFSLKNLPLKGLHNYINIMSAISAAKYLGIREEEINSALSTYINAPHRMEFAGEIDGVTFINDSKATNVDSVFYALDAYNTSITWIAGGIDKGNNYDQIISLVSEKVKTLICLGIDNKKLKESFEGVTKNILETTDIRQAARKGLEYSQRNDVVLLSPACASFDLFKNYEDRGEQFKNAVTELKKEMEAKTI